MIKTSILSVALGVLSLSAFADSKSQPISKTFSNGQMLNLTLSDTDINKLQVIGDEIVHITCPNGLCAVNYYSDDRAGAAFVSIGTDQPFTLYVNTKADRQFSIQVNPVASPGVTYQFQSLSGGLKAAVWEKNADYEQVLEELLTAVVNNQTPEDYGFADCTIKGNCGDMGEWALDSIVKLKPASEYVGDNLEVQVYSVANVTNQTIDLFEKTLAQNNPNIRAMSLSKQVLKPHEQGMVYQVVGIKNGDQQ